MDPKTGPGGSPGRPETAPGATPRRAGETVPIWRRFWGPPGVQKEPSGDLRERTENRTKKTLEKPFPPKLTLFNLRREANTKTMYPSRDLISSSLSIYLYLSIYLSIYLSSVPRSPLIRVTGPNENSRKTSIKNESVNDSFDAKIDLKNRPEIDPKVGPGGSPGGPWEVPGASRGPPGRFLVFAKKKH